MRLARVFLAPDARTDEFDCVGMRCRPVEAVPEGFGYYRACACMVAAVPCVYVAQDLASFFGGDAPLKHSGDAALIELLVDDGEGLASAHDHTGLRFIHGQDLPLEVVDVRLRPVPSVRDDCD